MKDASLTALGEHTKPIIDTLAPLKQQMETPTRPQAASLGSGPLGVFASRDVAPRAEEARAAGAEAARRGHSWHPTPGEDEFLSNFGLAGKAVGTVGSAIGSSVKLASDIGQEAMAGTHVGRAYEGAAGDVRRDPEWNTLVNKQFALHDELANSNDPNRIRDIYTELNATQADMERRAAEVRQEFGVTDLGSAYQRGLRSPNRR